MTTAGLPQEWVDHLFDDATDRILRYMLHYSRGGSTFLHELYWKSYPIEGQQIMVIGSISGGIFVVYEDYEYSYTVLEEYKDELNPGYATWLHSMYNFNVPPKEWAIKHGYGNIYEEGF